MTQKRSSFKDYWFVDFLARLFGFWYYVKADGDSPEKHNFRRCSNEKCKAFIFKLNVDEQEIRCPNSKCDKVVLMNKGFGTRYRDKKKRYFYLDKSLYNPLMSWWILITVLSLIFLVLTYRLTDIPMGYSLSGIDCSIWVLLLVNLFLLIFYYAADVNPQTPILIFFLKCFSMPFSFVVVLFTLPIFLPGVGSMFIPIWVEVPMEIEWQMQKKKEVQEILDGMEPGVVRFEVALKGDVDPEFYFIEAVKVDFDGVMFEHSSFVKQLSPSSEEVFYNIMYAYLVSMDSDKLIDLCIHDEWDIIYNKTTVEKHYRVLKVCSNTTEY